MLISLSAPNDSNLELEGYVILKKVFTESELSGLGSICNQVQAWGEKGLSDPFENYYLRHRTDQGVLYDLYQRHPEFRKLAENKIILSCLQTVLGATVLM